MKEFKQEISGKVFVKANRNDEVFRLAGEFISHFQIRASIAPFTISRAEPSGFIPDLIKCSKVALLSPKGVSKYLQIAKRLAEELNLEVLCSVEKLESSKIYLFTMFTGTIKINHTEVSKFNFVDLLAVEEPSAIILQNTRGVLLKLTSSLFKPKKLLIPGGTVSIVEDALSGPEIISVSELESMDLALVEALQDYKSGFNARQLFPNPVPIQRVREFSEAYSFLRPETELPELLSFVSVPIETLQGVSDTFQVRSTQRDEYIALLNNLSSQANVIECDDLAETFGRHLMEESNDDKITWLVPRFNSIESTQAAIQHFITQDSDDSTKVLLVGFPEAILNSVSLYSMQYGTSYVASINISFDKSQAIQALYEANSFTGKAIVVANLPSVYRWNPSANTEEAKFSLDSASLRAEMEKFLKANNQLSLIAKQGIEDFAKSQGVEQRLKAQYEKLLSEGSSTKVEAEDDIPVEEKIALLVLYGSDSGNGQGLAEKVVAMARTQSKYVMKVRVCEANEYSFDDLKEIDVDKEEFEFTSKKNRMSGVEGEKLKKVVLFVLSTAGQGEPTMNAKQLYDEIISAKQNKTNNVNHIMYSVFGLGDSHYWGKGSSDSEKYFCLPARLIDAKFRELNGVQICDAALGDDQDDDGYSTQFNVWVNNLFKSLGLEIDPRAVEDLTPQIVDDDIKEKSGYLRGNIDDGLKDLTTLKLLPEDTKLTKFHGIYQQDLRSVREELDEKHLERAYSFMIRVGLPGGTCTPQQLIDMVAICSKYANGVLKLTTRQAFQLHGVVKKDLKTTMQAINRGCMNTLAACGDVNRNVIANPFNEVSTGPNDSEKDFIAYLAKGLDAHLKPKTSAYHEIWLNKKKMFGFGESDYEPIYGRGYLPRKFKIAIAVPPLNDVDVFSHCLGFVAILDKTKNNRLLGFNVSVGGGMGTTHNNPLTYPKLAPLLGFVPYSHRLSQKQNLELYTKVAESVVILQRDHGERANRKHARLKYTVEDKGIAWFQKEVKRMLGSDGDKLEKPRKFKFTRNADEFGWSQTLKLNGTSLYKCTLFIENGVVKDENKDGLVHLAEVFQKIAAENEGIPGPKFALTANQHLAVLHVPESAKGLVQGILEKYNLNKHEKSSQLRLHSMACVALPTCALAMAEAQTYMPTLITRVENILEDLEIPETQIVMRMTGCPNGCARPYMAEIAFVGKAPGQYNMYLGGGFAGNRLNKPYKEGIAEPEILEILRELLTQYKVEATEGERFGDFVIRKGIIEPVLDGKYFWKTGEENNTTGKAQVYW
eukprot:augustus_masked-scaffold_5-processed-gene-2.5-mRNA-1 protein AED:0.12 eAED:0.12 QI:0/-1/0/1/-1/1/1/0/1279